MTSNFPINEEHKRWAKRARRKYKQSAEDWENLIKKQSGKCALTDAPLLFDVKSGTPKKGGPGCHPLYAAVDHKLPTSEFQILCYDINDLKGHLPEPLINALMKTAAWKQFKTIWKKTAQLSLPSSKNIKALKNLIKTRKNLK